MTPVGWVQRCLQGQHLRLSGLEQPVDSGLCPALGGVPGHLPHWVNAQTFPGARALPPAPAEAPQRVRAVRYLDPVHRVMNDGGLRLLQKKEAQGKEGGG